MAWYQKVTDLTAKVILTLAGLIVGLDVLSIFRRGGGPLPGRLQPGLHGGAAPFGRAGWWSLPMMGVLLKFKKHISVELLPDKLKGRARSLVLICVYTVVLAVAIQFLLAGIIAVAHYRELGFETHTEIVFKIWVTYLPFPVGFGLLILFVVEMLLQELVNLLKVRGEGR